MGLTVKVGRRTVTLKPTASLVPLEFAVGVFNGKAYVGYLMDCEMVDDNGNTIDIATWPVLVFEDEVVLYEKDTLAQMGARRASTPVEMENWWSGTYVDVDPKSYYQEVFENFKYYIDAPEHRLHFLSIWTIGTVFHMLFHAYPYLFLYGIKRCGKSLDRDAIVLTLTKTGEVKPVKIGNLVDEMLRIGGVVREGNYEMCYSNPLGIKLLQLNPTTFKLEWVEPKAFIRHPFKGKMLRVRTRLGREILATKDHSFIVFRDGEISVVDGSSLKVGDVFLTVKHVPAQQGRPLDWRLGYLHGIFLAEGSRDGLISTHDQNVLNILEDYMNTLGIPYTKPPSIKGKGLRLGRQAMESFMFGEFVKDYEGKGLQYRKAGARYKTIPEFVFTANEEYRRSFIAGYIDGDGYVGKRRRGAAPRIEVVSKSRDVIDRLGVLLSLEGIVYSRSVKRHRRYGTFYRLCIVGSGLNEFMEKVAPFMRKREKVERLMDIVSSAPRYTLADTVKGISGVLRNISEKRFSIFTKKCKWANPYNLRTGRMTLDHLKEAVNRIEEFIRRTDISHELSVLRRLLQADVITDEVASIEEEDYEGYVYDLSTSYENFVANDIVVHNTKTLTLVKCMGFNAIRTHSMSEATIYRLVESAHATVLLDEQDYLANPERRAEFRALLLGGYKKGSFVYRSEKTSKGKIVPTKFRIYSPKALANIEGLENVLQDRTITVTMKRSVDPSIIRRDVDEDDPKWMEMRTKLASLYVKYWREVSDAYMAVLNALGDVEDMSGIPENLRPLFHNAREFIYSRNRELWSPIIALALFFELKGVEGLVKKILEVAKENVAEKESEEIETPEVGLVYALKAIYKGDGYYALSDITQQYKQETGIEKIDPRSVGRMLRRLDITGKIKRSGTMHYFITSKMIEDLATRLNVEFEGTSLSETPQNPETPQTPLEGLIRRAFEWSRKKEFFTPGEMAVELGIPLGTAEKIVEILLNDKKLAKFGQKYMPI